MKLTGISILLSCCLLLIGCRNSQTPSTDTQSLPLTKADVANNNQSNNPVAQVEQAAKAASEQQNANTGSTTKFRMPAFIDNVKGGIVDLPAYKDATVSNMQYGPIQGADTAMIIYQSSAPFEQVLNFYKGVIPRQGWTIVSQQTVQGISEFKLAKGDRDEAFLRILQNQQSGATDILMSRIQKLPESKPQ